MTTEETQKVLSMLNSISNSQESTNLRLNSIDGRLDGIDKRLVQIEDRLRKIEKFVPIENADFQLK